MSMSGNPPVDEPPLGEPPLDEPIPKGDPLFTALKRAVAKGRVADFRKPRWKELAENDGGRPKIAAGVVNRLVLGDHAPRGIRIKGVTIDGDLDLTYARGAGGVGCNGLELDNCDLPTLDARHSHLSHLSLVNCRTNRIRLSRAMIDGDLNLNDLHALSPSGRSDGGDGGCWVRARHIRVGGSVTMNGAHLRGKTAIDLESARVAGSLSLESRFIAEGLVDLSGASIGGLLLARGARLSVTGTDDSGTTAVKATAAHVGGSVLLSDRFKAVGTVELDDATIGGSLVTDGARLVAHPSGEGNPVALSAQSLQVDGSVSFHSGFLSIGEVDFQGAEIGGDLIATHARFIAWCQDQDGTALSAILARVGGSVFLKEGFLPVGSVDFRGATLTGNLHGDFSAPRSSLARAWARATQMKLSEKAHALDLTDATIRGSLRLEHFRELDATDLSIGSSADLLYFDGSVKLHGSQVGRDLIVATADRIHYVGATGLTVGGTLTVCGAVSKEIDLSRSHIDKLILGRGPDQSGIPDALVLRSGSRLRLQDARISHLQTGSIDAEERSRIDLTGLRVVSLDDRDGAGWFGEEVANVDRRPSVLSRSQALVRLRPRGKKANRRSKVQLKLKDFEYERIDRRTQRTSGERLKSRRSWLTAQYTDDPVSEDEYEPQPFQQLAKVWRAEGSYGAADDVTHDKLALERTLYPKTGRPSWWVRWLAYLIIPLVVALAAIWRYAESPANVIAIAGLTALAGSLGLLAFVRRGDFAVVDVLGRLLRYWAFELPFGYGLRTKNAFATFLIVWAVGWALLSVGSEAVMKVDASTVSTVASTSSGDIVVPVDKPDDSLSEVPCGDNIDAPLYALDVMVPLLDLRQEARCKVSAEPWAAPARDFKVIYAVLGWIVTSGLILTVSGIVRRQVEN